MRVHGYAPDQAEIDALIIGGDSKLSVEEQIGTPPESGIQDANAWYYVESTVRTMAFFAPEVTERRVLVLDFDDQGILRDVARFGLEQGQVVNLQTRVTPTESRRVSVLRRLLGNVGSITPPLPEN